MKKRLIVSFILVAIIGLVVSLILNQKEKLEEKTTAEIFLITTIQEKVFFKKPEASDFSTTSKEEVVPVYTRIKTSETGRAVIEAGKNVITTIDRNSEFTVEKYDESQSRIVLHSGNLWSRLEKTLERGEFYEIQTENAVATVRGTSFGTSFIDSQMSIIVKDGTVTAFLIDKKTGGRIEESKMEISAGEKVTIGETIVVEKITSKDKESEWYIFNNKEKLLEIKSKDLKTDIVTKPNTNVDTPASTTFPVIDNDTKTVSITSIIASPSSIQKGSNVLVTLRGKGFLHVKNLFLDTQAINNYKIIDDSKIQFSSSIFGENDGIKEFKISLVAIDNTIATARIVVNTIVEDPQLIPENNTPDTSKPR